MAEKATEWGETVWVASLDVEKAFDTVFHTSVLEGMTEAGAAPEVCRFLKNMLTNAIACVDCGFDDVSRTVKLQRGMR